MDFSEARIAIDILEKYQCGQTRDWGDDDNRNLPIEGGFEFGHDVCWITLPQTTDNPDLTDDERQRLEDAGWFFDDQNDAWSHF